MDRVSKKLTYRRWALVNTFMMLFMLGVILVVGSNRADIVVFGISAPLSLAVFGTFMVDHLLSYFECVTHVNNSESDKIDKH